MGLATLGTWTLAAKRMWMLLPSKKQQGWWQYVRRPSGNNQTSKVHDADKQHRIAQDISAYGTGSLPLSFSARPVLVTYLTRLQAPRSHGPS